MRLNTPGHSPTGQAQPPTEAQGKQVLQDGVGRCPETEVDLPPAQARAYLEDPNKLLDANLPIVDALKRCARAQRKGWGEGRRRSFWWSWRRVPGLHRMETCFESSIPSPFCLSCAACSAVRGRPCPYPARRHDSSQPVRPQGLEGTGRLPERATGV